MFDLMIIAAMAKARQHEVLEEAKRDRWLQNARATRLGLRGRLLKGLGDLLISTGQKLQERCTPVAPQGSRAYSSGP